MACLVSIIEPRRILVIGVRSFNCCVAPLYLSSKMYADARLQRGQLEWFTGIHDNAYFPHTIDHEIIPKKTY